MEQIRTVQIPNRGSILSIEDAMELAMSEAYKGSPFVSPNPLVGAVVLDNHGGFLSSGYHEIYGSAHAEINALKDLTPEQLAGAHVIVTLEPCAHEGKTPSCAKTMARLPLKKVTFGIIDPNPLVAGQGAKILQEAGIEAELFHCDDEVREQQIKKDLEEVCEAFLWNFRNKKVFVALKMASSIDGQVALKSGESQWITGPESREYVHFLRSCYDAVLVGRGTIEFDNPSLNIRHPKIIKENKVIILDCEGQLLRNHTELKLLKCHKKENIFWCVSEELRENIKSFSSEDNNLPQIIFVKTTISGEFDLTDLLAQLFDRGIRSLLIEGGAMTASLFVAHKLVNRIYLFQAPIIMGSGGSKSWTESVRIAEMKDKLKIQNPKFLTFGGDFMITGRLN
jgi:diaminohydroxyphosphoribosylaminopyrimidine deaminase/5-amino-6-(5-phosphoribosylamino)uracil reductase